MKQKPWLKWISIFLTVVLSIGILYTMWGFRKTRQAEKAQLEVIAAEYSARLRPLWERKASLESQLYDLDKAHREEKDTTTYIVLLATEPDARVMTDILPMVEGKEYTGVVALGEDSMPGAKGCLTADQLKQLVKKGWEICLRADANTGIVALNDQVKALGFTPTAVYFPDDDCTELQKTQMQQLGMGAMVCYGRSVPTEVEGSLLRFCAYGSNEKNARTVFDSAVSKATVLALTVGYENGREKFDSENFGNMLATIAKAVKSEKSKVAGIGDVTKLYLGNEERWALQEKQYNSRRSQLEAQLVEVTAQIQAIE